MNQAKITAIGVISEGVGIGIKNAASLLLASILWIVTIWIPFLNVGTTIAMKTIPIELSKGKVISPLFIFDEKYRKYMGEFFTLTGMKWLSIIPAMTFMIIPGLIISIGWSLAIYILLDKGMAPGAAMIRSNKVTYGYKSTIFGVSFLLVVGLFILVYIATKIHWIVALLPFIVYKVVALGCAAVIYRDLAGDIPVEE